ncbi:MAG: hypothetical protein ABSG03_33845, partial [Bryobacteraceae bacterium]
GREPVELGHLVRRVRGALRRGRVPGPEVGPELRPGVKAEHGQHDSGQRGRNVSTVPSTVYEPSIAGISPPPAYTWKTELHPAAGSAEAFQPVTWKFPSVA